MKVGMIGNHYPRADHREAFIARMQHVAATFRSMPGCLAADCWLPDSGDAVVSTVQWESEEAMAASFAALEHTDVDIAYDEREVRPREIVRLTAL
ncbi:hypothetical protein GCM10027570_41430 [Streptomonospora sediminis]